MTTAANRRQRPTTPQRGYGEFHQAARKRLAPMVAAGGARCWRCGEPILPAEPWDLGHLDGDRTRYGGPEHARCNRATMGRVPWWTAAEEPEPERPGLAADDPRWRVPWLAGLLDPPDEGIWPRLMTVPHAAAVGSLGGEFIAYAEARSGRALRWWQRLVAVRLLEVDRGGLLLWETLILSMARQLGKSWLLRELVLWRIHQGERFGEPQDVLHTGKDLAVCKEVQRPARVWAKARRDRYKVREVNGQEEIELLVDASRWMVRAKDAVYGYSSSVGAVDEAWKVHPRTVDEGLVPTMVEREQPQLWLLSTAHRAATSLMLIRRRVALDSLELGEGDLLIEWSAGPGVELDDVDGWRAASPHWTTQRHRLVGKQLEAALAGEEADDPEEPDPVEAFRAQWLNQWPRRIQVPDGRTEDLLPPGLWDALADSVDGDGPLWVAIEDDYGLGAAVAAASRLEDGRIEVDGWLCADWDSAIRDLGVLGLRRRVRHLQIGASMLDRVPAGTVPTPTAAGSSETRVALALFRDLANAGSIVHDETFDLDDAIPYAQVRELPGGLQLAPRGPTHLLKALVWAVQAAHRPTPVPAIL